MRLKFVFSVLILVTAVVVISCDRATKVATKAQGPKGPEVTYADGARRISIDEFEAMRQNGEVFVVDVRNQASYDAGHIPGARLIPAAEIANHLNELPRDKTIVTYCS